MKNILFIHQTKDFCQKLGAISLCVALSVSLIGCESKNTTNKSDEASDKTSVEVTTQEITREQSTITAKEAGKTPGVISSSTALSFTSNIDTYKDPVQASLEIDKKLQAEVDSGKYTPDNPYITVNPFGNSPLTAVIIFSTDTECGVRVTVKGKTETTNVSDIVDKAKNHRIPVIGLYAGTTNEVIVELLDDSDNVIDTKTYEIQTDSLPETMNDAVKVEEHNATMSYGMIEVSGFGYRQPFAFDENGDIRWYLSGGYASYGYFPLSNNRFIIMDGDIMIATEEKPHAQQLYEMDYIGRTHQIYLVENGAHHEIIEKTPGGNLLIASNSVDEHVEDVIEEIDRTTGAVVKRLVMDEILGDSFKDMIDWAHVNTVAYYEEDDSVLISPRNTHSAVKINWTTNEIIWILSDPTAWKGTDLEKYVLKNTTDEDIWFYQQHTPYQLSADLDNNPDTVEVAVFDNHWQGTRKIKTYYKEGKSSVKVYAINEKEGTVTMLRNFLGLTSKITSNFVFNSDAMTMFYMGGFLAHPEDNNGRKAIIYEFDYETNKVLNAFSTAKTFYRAYAFEPDFNTCATPMEVSEGYLRGTLDIAQKVSDYQAVPSEVLTDEIRLLVSEHNLLYLKAKDHEISQVEFVSDTSDYVINLGYTSGESKYKNTSYKIVVPFQNLESGTYSIVVTFNGTRYDTGKKITI